MVGAGRAAGFVAGFVIHTLEWREVSKTRRAVTQARTKTSIELAVRFMVVMVTVMVVVMVMGSGGLEGAVWVGVMFLVEAPRC